MVSRFFRFGVKIFSGITDSYQLVILLALYALAIVVSFVLAHQLRYDFAVPTDVQRIQWLSLLWLLPLKLMGLFWVRQMNTMWGYFRLPDVFRVAFARLITSLCALAVCLISHVTYAPGRGIILIDYIFSFFAIAGLRTSIRFLYERYQHTEIKNRKRTAIIGAGDNGARIAGELMYKKGLGFKPVLFLDDDPQKIGKSIHGLPIMGSPECLAEMKKRYSVEAVIIALPYSCGHRTKQIIELTEKLNLTARILPSFNVLATNVELPKLRPVEFENLLAREPVRLDQRALRSLIQDKVVWVTGAGGSIGSELVRQVASNHPQLLVLIDHSEFLLFEIEQELKRNGFVANILPCIADIKDTERVSKLLAAHKPNIIFHAAAYKHVPIMEYQPEEAIRNNTLGSIGLAMLASANKVERFIFISTDKAINPTSVMGASKRIAEKAIQALQKRSGNSTHFISVRFGNVLGSSGSVIPIFKRQIAEGGPVTVTHPDVKRYFMTIPEAAGLVLQSASMGTGGEIFVLDMGAPIKIADVARRLIELSGLEPEVDIPIQYIGLRPGEKLFEELQHTMEHCSSTRHPRIRLFTSTPDDWHKDVRPAIDELEYITKVGDTKQLKLFMKHIVPEYVPYVH